MSDNEEWIDYWAKPKPEQPTEGFVEIIDTWDDKHRTYMDMSRPCSDMIIWNRAAHVCVSKYRFIPEEKYQSLILEHLKMKLSDLNTQIQNVQTNIEQVQERLKEISNDQ